MHFNVNNQGWAIAHSLISLCSFALCSFAPRSFALCSFALHSFPLFSKERLCDRSHKRSLNKSEWAIALFVALFKRAKEQSLFCRSFEKSEWAIALFLLFSKERRKERSLFCSFKKSERAKMSDRSLSIWTNTGQLIRSFAQSLIDHFQKSNCANKWAIAL